MSCNPKGNCTTRVRTISNMGKNKTCATFAWLTPDHECACPSVSARNQSKIITSGQCKQLLHLHNTLFPSTNNPPTLPKNVENEGPTGSENYKFENEQRIDFKNDKFIRKQVLSNLNNMVWGYSNRHGNCPQA